MGEHAGKHCGSRLLSQQDFSVGRVGLLHWAGQVRNFELLQDQRFATSRRALDTGSKQALLDISLLQAEGRTHKQAGSASNWLYLFC